MAATTEIAFGHINRLIDVLGYVLMMLLSLILWWGIYSGVEITVASGQSQDKTESDRTANAHRSLFPSDDRQASNLSTAVQTEQDSWRMVAAY